MMFRERMGNLTFQIICLLLIWCGSFALFKLDAFLFLCLLFFIYLSVSLLFLVPTRHYSPCHLLQTQTSECWFLTHFLIAHPVLYYFLIFFLKQTQCFSRSGNCQYHLLHCFQLHLTMHIFYRCQFPLQFINNTFPYF